MNPVPQIHPSHSRMEMALCRVALKAMAARERFVDTLPASAQVELPPVLQDSHAELPSDRDFVDMLAAYRATGGIVRTDDLARLLKDRPRVGMASLASLIRAGDVFGFEWRRSYWLPMFQFELRDLAVRSAPRQVIAELAADFDGLGLALWFAQPNSWLCDRRPVDLLNSQLNDVLDAARADRFIATG